MGNTTIRALRHRYSMPCCAWQLACRLGCRPVPPVLQWTGLWVSFASVQTEWAVWHGWGARALGQDLAAVSRKGAAVLSRPHGGYLLERTVPSPERERVLEQLMRS